MKYIIKLRTRRFLIQNGENFALLDKHILIKDGHPATKFYGQSELTIHDSKGTVLSYGKWHQVEAIQISGSKCIFRVNGKQVGEHLSIR
jgi:hypothetical protein